MHYFFDEDFIDSSNETNNNFKLENQPLSNNLSCEECLELGKVIYSINKEYSFDNFSKKLHILPMQSTTESCNHINFVQAADKLVEENNVYFCIDKIGFIGSINCSEEFIIANESDFKKILTIAKHMNDSFKLEIVMVPYKSDKLADINVKYEDIFGEKKEEIVDNLVTDNNASLSSQETNHDLTKNTQNDTLIDSIFKLTQHTLCLTKKMNFLDLKLENIETNFDDNTESEVCDYWCDHCDRLILGTRYKCFSCLDFDLCEECEKLDGIHIINHNFIKVKYPMSYKKWKKYFFSSMKVQSQNNSQEILNDPESIDILSTNPFYQPIQITKKKENEPSIEFKHNENPFLKTNKNVNLKNDLQVLTTQPESSLLEINKKGVFKKNSSILNKDLKKSIDLQVENSIKKFFKKYKQMLIKEQDEKNACNYKQDIISQDENQKLASKRSYSSYNFNSPEFSKLSHDKNTCKLKTKYLKPDSNSFLKPLPEKESSSCSLTYHYNEEHKHKESDNTKDENYSKTEVSNTNPEIIRTINLENNKKLYDVVFRMTKNQYEYIKSVETSRARKDNYKKLVENNSIDFQKKKSEAFSESLKAYHSDSKPYSEQELEEAFKEYDEICEEMDRKERLSELKKKAAVGSDLWSTFNLKSVLKNTSKNTLSKQACSNDDFWNINRTFGKCSNFDKTKPFSSNIIKSSNNEENKSVSEISKSLEEINPAINEKNRPCVNLDENDINLTVNTFDNIEMVKDDSKSLEKFLVKENSTKFTHENNLIGSAEFFNSQEEEFLNTSKKNDLLNSNEENILSNSNEEKKLSEVPQNIQNESLTKDSFFNIQLNNSGRSSPDSEFSSSSSYEMIMTDSFKFDLEKNFEGLNISNSENNSEKNKEKNISTKSMLCETGLFDLDKIVVNEPIIFADKDKKDKFDEKMTSSKTSIYKSLIDQNFDETSSGYFVKDEIEEFSVAYIKNNEKAQKSPDELMNEFFEICKQKK